MRYISAARNSDALRCQPIVRSRGYALIILLTLLVVGSVSYIAHGFSKASLDTRRDIKTREALEAARDAVIKYAARVTNADGSTNNDPGRLPCPDLTPDPASADYGKAESACGTIKTRVGRLPWKTIGLKEELKDGYGEPLWYAISRCFLKRNADQYCGQYLINSNTQGQLAVAGTDISDAVIIVFSPGLPLPGQQRVPNTSAFIEASNFLEGENADGETQPFEEDATPKSDSRDHFESRARCDSAPCPSGYFNDQLLPVRKEEYFSVLEAYVQSRIEREIRPLLQQHDETWGFYPYAAALDGRHFDSPPPLPMSAGVPGTFVGTLPVDPSSEMEGWQLAPSVACSNSAYDVKSNAKIKGRSAQELNEPPFHRVCRIRAKVCRKYFGPAYVQFEFRTKLDSDGHGWLDRGFFGAASLSDEDDASLKPSAHTKITSQSVIAGTGQGKIQVRAQDPGIADLSRKWQKCGDEEDDENASAWTTIQLDVAPPRSLVNIDDMEWLVKNEWNRVIGYQVSRGASADPSSSDMLKILNANGDTSQSRAALVMAGYPLTNAAIAVRRASPPQCPIDDDPIKNEKWATYLNAFFDRNDVKTCKSTLAAPEQLTAGSHDTSPFNDRVIPLPLQP